MIELFKTGRASMKFDRMIPSGSSWLMGIKVHRVYDEADAAMEAGKTISVAKKYRIEIKRIRLDNSGENKSLQKECDKQNLGIIFEFTAPGTPQQNSVAERRIPTLMGRARAMLIQAGLEAKYKEEFWCEVISTATKLDNIMMRPERTKPPHTLFYGEDAKYARSLRTFGEMAVVAIHEGKKMRSKLDSRGKTCMFVGYADDHTKDVYRFLNIHTTRIILSRDVRWLNVMWKRYKKKSIYARSRVELFSR